MSAPFERKEGRSFEGGALSSKYGICYAQIFTVTAWKMKISIKDFFSKCDKNRSLLWIWSLLSKKSLIENFIFCAVCKLNPKCSSDLTRDATSYFFLQSFKVSDEKLFS